MIFSSRNHFVTICVQEWTTYLKLSSPFNPNVKNEAIIITQVSQLTTVVASVVDLCNSHCFSFMHTSSEPLLKSVTCTHLGRARWQKLKLAVLQKQIKWYETWTHYVFMLCPSLWSLTYFIIFKHLEVHPKISWGQCQSVLFFFLFKILLFFFISQTKHRQNHA